MRDKDNVIDATVGLRVRIARRAKGLTLEQLADAVGCKQPQLTRLEFGRETWSAARLSAVAAVVGVSIDLLCPVLTHEQQKAASDAQAG